MNEFDIFLNKRLTECDLIIHSLPYRDGLTVVNAMVLESVVLEYLLLKRIAVQSQSVLEAHIDDMLKICCEKLSNHIEIDASAAFHALYSAYSESCDIILSADALRDLLYAYFRTENDIRIDTAPINIYAAKHFGHGNSEMILEVE